MSRKLQNNLGQFGTTPVFIASISTILGAILFLRFGYAVGNVGFFGAIAIIILGHAVTIPTALAVAEIATNRKVEGGGDYYVISRSFGINIGAAIGVALFLSQAISVSFYVIAFAESFIPFGQYLNETYNIGCFLENKKIIGLISMGLLSILILSKGAELGVKALYIVASIIFVSLILFFLGKNQINYQDVNFFSKVENADNFFYVFTIIFPAFTGISAGLGLSGDLKEPRKSIPRGTILATILGAIVYVLVAYKLTISIDLNSLANDQLVMSDIALWGPIIPIGLACAAISSALGSIIVAPRTLQALAKDKIFPNKNLDLWLSKGKKENNEPLNGTIVTCLIAFFFVYIGDINFVARIISMFFMVTYGAICLISFLEHFSGDPSYRPAFKSRWYISLMGALLSIWLMFKMDTLFAFLSILIMISFYYFISKKSSDNREFVNLFKDVLEQLARQLQIFIQRKNESSISNNGHWRPFVVSISDASLIRNNAFDVTRWIAYKYGFGTYIHYIKGYLSKQNFEDSQNIKHKLIEGKKTNVYVDTLISPSYTSALAQVVQLSGISGTENNLILLEYCESDKDSFKDVMNNFNLLHTTGYDVAIMRSNNIKKDKKEEIHIWISPTDYENSNMMILLGYIILGHPDWKNAQIKVFTIYPKNKFEEYKNQMFEYIEDGRLPISPKNMKMVPYDEDVNYKETINKRSSNSDLTILGFRDELVKKHKLDIFEGYNTLGNILFVNSIHKKNIE
ncbi:MAG: amino acid permease [Flavobacteriales bacterium]|nr:amino acid permease [Flavobacteriales bacterium]